MLLTEIANGDRFVNSASKSTHYFEKKDDKFFEFFKMPDGELVEEEVSESILTYLHTITTWKTVTKSNIKVSQ